ncbi:hypothetical protein ACJQWK_04434 [Exserohilum turcicum]|uniref:Uncharacterized protein n=1 Tax=Exserohilum turcicum (strain 28A) TaxID=671987 RepID=R0K3A3_EXST2|nr:uncharacterized protein SETTUDRAFT_34387 [Exserohilum turcica Et28A]EOA82862.1 hypothetical protein SETTUDRAFT_34387 [Exserohilum turcica Et28A]
MALACALGCAPCQRHLLPFALSMSDPGTDQGCVAQCSLLLLPPRSAQARTILNEKAAQAQPFSSAPPRIRGPRFTAAAMRTLLLTSTKPYTEYAAARPHAPCPRVAAQCCPLQAMA